MNEHTHLIIDMGNTYTKVLVFEKDAIRWRKIYPVFRLEHVRTLIQKFKPTASIVCSVVKTPASIRNFLVRNTQFVELSGKTPVPLKMRYLTPETLGADRLAGIVGASKLFPAKNVLVIDLGTCIKYDFLSQKREYAGGSISPGLNMRLKALHDYTERLPLLQPASVKGFTGKDTWSSMLTGVQTGILAELEGFISRYKKMYGAMKIVLTGGDAPRFAGQLKIPIFAAPDLVGIGLNEILNFNAQI